MINKGNEATKVGIGVCIMFLVISWVYAIGKISDNIFGLISIVLMFAIIVVDAYLYYYKNREHTNLYIVHIILLIWIVYIVISRW